LSKSESQFDELCNDIFQQQVDAQAVGVFFFELSSMGFLPLGILISHHVYGSSPPLENNQSYANNVFTHELTHHVYFYHFDFTNLKKPHLWFTEGVAEYVANSSYRKGEIDRTMLRRIRLTDPGNINSAYWVGYTALKTYEVEWGRQSVTDLITNSYTLPLEQAVINSSGNTMHEWESRWKAQINDFNP
jgi:hypothetical protein